MTVRECTHPRVRHVHGTRNAYVRDRCRCDPCRAAATAAESGRRRQKAYGRYDGLVDAEPAREHIRALSANGVGLKTITRLTGVSGGVLTKLVYGHPLPDGTRRPPSRRCTPRVRDRILSVPLTAVSDGARVDGTGTRRRLQALVVVGWSQCQLARRLGMARSNFGKTIKANQVRASTAEAVRALYDELWNQPPPESTHREKIAAARARNTANEYGWLPPMAWDDDTIDNNQVLLHTCINEPRDNESRAFIDEIAVSEAVAGRPVALTKAEKSEAVARLRGMGYSAKASAERLGTTSRTVVRRRTENRNKAA